MKTNEVIVNNNLNYTAYYGGIGFNPSENQFYCPHCGSKMYWNGGRYNPGMSHMMEVIECSNCGHSIDPRLVIDTCYWLYETWQAELAAAKKATKAAEAQARKEAAFSEKAAKLDSLLDRIAKTNPFSKEFTPIRWALELARY